MKLKSVLAMAICIGLLLIAHSFAKDSESNMGAGQNRYKPPRSAFRYVIVRNDVIRVTGDSEDAYRFVEVLLEEKAFSEKILKELFSLVTKRFPTPTRMDIRVYTSLEQINTPEERDAGGVSEGPDDATSDKYHRALFIRSSGGDELFRYSISTPVRGLKTIILKGKDPHAPRSR